MSKEITVDLTKVLVNLKNEEIKTSNEPDAKSLAFGEALANVLLVNKVDPLRALTLARIAYDSPETAHVFDASDVEFIKTAIKAGQNGYNSLVLGQLLEVFA